MQQRRGCLASLFWLAILAVVVVYGVIGVTAPWSLHIGGRWTPLISWHGTGKLLTKSGAEYPLYVFFFPSSHFSHLHMDGLRPTGGLRGTGLLCTSPGVIQQLKLSGTIYGGWSSTEGSLMEFRLLEPKIIDVGQKEGYFDLYGRWRGPALVMDDRGRPGGAFRSGVRIEHALVTLEWGSSSDFQAACASPGRKIAD